MRLEKLLAELCPDGVEYKPFGEMCDIITKQTGFDYTNTIKDSLSREKAPNTLPYIQTKFFTGKVFDYETDYYIPDVVAERFPKIVLDQKCILFSIVGASIGNVGLFSGEQKAFLGGAICVAKPKKEYNADYLYYYLSSKYGQKQIFRKVKGAGQATVTIEDIREFIIPVPPLEVQAEIVRILDEYTESVTALQLELEKEFTARKRQYEYYRDELLSFNDGECEWQTLLSVANIIRGTRVVKKQLQISGEYPVFQNCLTPMGFYEESNRKSATTFVIGAGAAGEIGYSDIDFWAADDCYTFECSELLNSKYLFYALQCQQSFLYSRVRKASIPRLSKTVLEKLKIPVPPIEEQIRIVSILDRFDKLCNDISDGLPAEIEARRKQYEYYRDKLLTFTPKG